MKSRQQHLLILRRAGLALAALSLVACSGGFFGGDDDNGDGGGFPTQSADEFSAYVGGLQADDTGEPLDLGTLAPPTSDTSEPLE